MKVLLTILIIIFSSCLIKAQSHDVIVDDEDMILRVTAKADNGASTRGDAFIDLLRNSDPASAAIRWNLNSAPTPNFITIEQERWLLGIDGDDDFKLTRRSVGTSAAGDTDAIVISDDENGDGFYDDPVVSFPVGYIDIGYDISLSTEQEGELVIAGGDILPSGFCTGQDIGNTSVFESWDKIVAQDYVTYTCSSLSKSTSLSLKSSSYNSLDKILDISAYSSPGEQKNGGGAFIWSLPSS